MNGRAGSFTYPPRIFLGHGASHRSRLSTRASVSGRLLAIYASPSSTGFHANEASFAIRKMLKEDSALELFAYDLPRFAINPVKLEEDVLRDIYTDRRILHFGLSRLACEDVHDRPNWAH